MSIQSGKKEVEIQLLLLAILSEFSEFKKLSSATSVVPFNKGLVLTMSDGSVFELLIQKREVSHG
jgi:hypothetical protein